MTHHVALSCEVVPGQPVDGPPFWCVVPHRHGAQWELRMKGVQGLRPWGAGHPRGKPLPGQSHLARCDALARMPKEAGWRAPGAGLRLRVRSEGQGHLTRRRATRGRLPRLPRGPVGPWPRARRVAPGHTAAGACAGCRTHRTGSQRDDARRLDRELQHGSPRVAVRRASRRLVERSLHGCPASAGSGTPE